MTLDPDYDNLLWKKINNDQKRSYGNGRYHYRMIAFKALLGISMENLDGLRQQINKRPALPHEENQMSLQGIPVTIIGGDLGCGKTTLLNALLHGKHGFAS